MNISAIIQRLTGTSRPGDAEGCPQEARILAYIEGTASASERTRVETHLTRCDDCRELLAVTIVQTDVSTAEPLSEKEIKQQAARVLAYVQLDEAKRGSLANEPKTRRGTDRRGIQLSFPRLASLALIASVAAAGTVMLITSDRNSDRGGFAAGMATLRQAMKDERRNQPLISGELPHTAYSPKRGEEVSDDLQYERALDTVKSAANDETAPVEERHTAARILLAKGGRDNVRKALVILDQLEAAGVQSAELLNDLGVARLQLGDYNAATDYFTRALQKSPGASESLFNKALAEQKAGRVDEARQDWNQFIAASPDERLKSEAEAQLSLLR